MRNFSGWRGISISTQIEEDAFMDLYKGKYRIPSTRLRTWDYSDPGMYSVTICVKHNWIPWFGHVINGEMQLSAMGKIVDECWQDISNHYKNVIVDEHIVMPNHTHGIIIIKNPHIADADQWTAEIYRQTCMTEFIVQTPSNGVSTINSTNPNTINTKPRNPHHRPEWKPGSLGSIIQQFKRACTIRIRHELKNFDFQWQPRFFDVILWNESDLFRTREYIKNNPAKWERDRNNLH
jgi:putative transposase